MLVPCSYHCPEHLWTNTNHCHDLFEFSLEKLTLPLWCHRQKDNEKKFIYCLSYLLFSSLIMLRAHISHTVSDGRRCQNTGQYFRQRLVSLSASKLFFSALIGIIPPAWSGFPLGKGCITDSLVLLFENPFARGFECEGQCNKSLSVLPAPASSQVLQDLPVVRHSFYFPADHSALGFEFTSDLELFIQNFLVFQLERKSLILHESLADAITYFPSRYAADMRW